MFDEVVGLLHAAAAERGLLVILDDLHRADVPSMRASASVSASEVPGCRLFLVELYGAGTEG
jgi:hypothetical protein